MRTMKEIHADLLAIEKELMAYESPYLEESSLYDYMHEFMRSVEDNVYREDGKDYCTFCDEWRPVEEMLYSDDNVRYTAQKDVVCIHCREAVKREQIEHAEQMKKNNEKIMKRYESIKDEVEKSVFLELAELQLNYNNEMIHNTSLIQ